MGMTEKNIWIVIHHYNEGDREKYIENENSLIKVTLPCVATFSELKSIVYSWANIKEDSSKVIKIRRYDNSLIPLSALFQGSSQEKPFIIEVVGIHQFCPIEQRKIPPAYINALKTKLIDLEKRVITVEDCIPEIASIHMKAVEEAANQLSNCVGFLDRRLDELAPSDWKTQIGLTI